MLINVVRVSEDEITEHTVQELKFDIKQSMGNVSVKKVT
jgi:hypothetical protein